MKQRLLYGAACVLLAICATVVIWFGSFRTDPASASQIFLYWAISSLVFILTVTLGFILFRTGVKLYVERQSNREGSRIKTKLVAGALALTFLPVTFLVLFSVNVLNYNLTRWFSKPGDEMRSGLVEVADSLHGETQGKADAQARWLAALPRVTEAVRNGRTDSTIVSICQDAKIQEAWVERADNLRVQICPARRATDGTVVSGVAMLADADGLPASRIIVNVVSPIDLALKEREIQQAVARFDEHARTRKDMRQFYLMLMVLITLFILFVATWIALFFSKQISVPISALLGAASEVRSGNLAYRIRVPANDELAALVRAFNEMTQDLESNQRELERRRRFTEAILENIPTGVVSVSSDGRILKRNRAFDAIFPLEGNVARIDDIFSPEEAAEIRYLMKRARRTGMASRQFEVRRDRQTVHLSVLVSALEENLASGFVMVIEDTSELLRAQKTVAWQEVARRVAHEIKNPLTPISLCAERLSRQIEKVTGPPDTMRIVRECSTTISQEVETVRSLVNEFSQYARFPVAQPVPSDLNELVQGALKVFEGRLDGIELYRNLGVALPTVNLDPEQFKRVIVNLVDNAAEAMQDSALKRIYVSTQLATPDSVELIISDTGRGISREDREKLFLPYFSTKGRGTGLGLALVAQILAEHKASIRVEDNVPAGARFVLEIPTALSTGVVVGDPRARETVG